MGQVISKAAKPKRCNLNKLLQLGTPAAGEYILVSSDNSMNATGQGNFDCYIVGDGTTPTTLLELKHINAADALMLSKFFSIKVTTGINMVNPAKYINEAYINSSGVEVSYPTWSHTPYIPVEAGVEYYTVGVNNNGVITPMRFVNWYDANKNPISQVGNQYYVTAPENAAYCICSTYNNNGNYSILRKTGLFKGHLSYAQFEEYHETCSLLFSDNIPFQEKDGESVINKEDVADLFGDTLDKTQLLSYTPEIISQTNLLNPSTLTKGYYRPGQTPAAFNTMVYSEEIPVSPNTQYSVRVYGISGQLGAARFVTYYNSSRTLISNEAMVSQFTTPSNCAYVVVSFYYKSTSDEEFDLTQTGLFLGSTYTFEPYVLRQASLLYLPNTLLNGKDGKELVTKDDISPYISSLNCIIVKSGNAIEFESGNDKFTSTLNNQNGIFNLQNVTFNSNARSISDDIAPTHTQNTTIGANHGDLCYAATITGHGLDNTSIGTLWEGSNGKNYVVMGIPNINTVVFQGENEGSRYFPIYHILPVGTTLTRNGTSLTVSAVAQYQLYPITKNVSHRVLVDNREKNGDFNVDCESLSIVEQYDIMSINDIQNNIIARAGSSAAAVYTGDSMLRVNNVFEFQKNMAIVATGTYYAISKQRRNDFMLLQASRITDAQYYMPNSLPMNGYDFRTPVTVPWSSSLPAFLVGESAWADANNPVNRVLMISSAECLAIGFIPTGVGAALKDYTNNTFELRNDTGKIYPHGVDNKIGWFMEAGDVNTLALYTCRFVPQTAPRLALYHYKYNGSTYVYVDYSASTTDLVIVEDSLNGKTIEVVESVNTTLKSNIYNGGFYVNANYVSGETCYIVVKI